MSLTGQLGRMLQEAAIPLGIEIVVLDAADCPLRQISSNLKHVTGSFNDAEKIRELARRCDILTVEIEHVNTDALKEIATRGVTLESGVVKKVPVHPSWETLELIKDKYLQKEHFAKAGLPIAEQIAIDPEVPLPDALRDAARTLGFPFMLKARKGSYDGRGNMKISSEDDFAKAAASMRRISLYAEKWVPFVHELAVMVVRTEDSVGALRKLHTYPAVETIHEDSICSKVLYPPIQVPPTHGNLSAFIKAQDTASEVVRTLKGRGVFAVEMFLLGDGKFSYQNHTFGTLRLLAGRITVNEVAPRPHNSGHLFIEALPYMSQFKAHLYSVLDIFPGDIKMQPRVGSAMMLNILGGAHDGSHDALVNLANTLYKDEMDTYLHLYGKASKPGRKIGHITTCCTSLHGSSTAEKLSAPLIMEVDRIRQERLEADPTQMTSSHISNTTDLSTTSKFSGASPKSSRNKQKPLVIITMGSDSDLPVLKGAFEILEHFNVPYDFTITSAHRTPQRMVDLGKSAASRGVRVLIAAAGGAAHLPGMLASETTVPVIGVPIKATHLDGQDSLLSIVQMPRGCPVATVGINNSTNAALLAVKILGSSDEVYRNTMANYMKNMSDEVEFKANKLRDLGWKEYLDGK